jgi:hypothetical protein
MRRVLKTIPVFFMSAFLLPKWVIRKIDQIHYRFLWHGHKDMQDNKRPIYLANWKLITKPKKLGGLGIRDIEAANQALLLKIDAELDLRHATMVEGKQHQHIRPWDIMKPTAFMTGLSKNQRNNVLFCQIPLG